MTPEAAAVQVTPTSYVSVSKWTRTHTSKLLFEGGVSNLRSGYTELYQPQVTEIDEKVFDMDAIGRSTVFTITEQTNGKVFNAWNAPADHFSALRTYSGAASYVTGSHSFRLGAAMSEGPRRTVQRYTGDLTMTFNNAQPQSVTLRTPLDQREGIKADVGAFAQDKWTIKRATINAGVRFDWFQGEVHDEDLPAGRWNPAAHFTGFDVQGWKDISPRLGVAYDLFGTGKTAIKFSIARYVNGEAAATAAANNPETTIGRTDVRSWQDANNDFTIFNADGSVQLNELGPTTNVNFGKLVPSTTSTDPNVLNGWHVKPNNWEYTASLQHELLPRVAVTVGYYRRSFRNQTVIDNQLTDGSCGTDGRFCINAPANPDLPGGGNYQVCGLYYIKPTAQGQVRNICHAGEQLGGLEDVFTGFDININARPVADVHQRRHQRAEAQLQHLRHAARRSGARHYRGGVRRRQSAGRQSGATILRPDVSVPARREDPGVAHLPWDVVVSGTYQFTQVRTSWRTGRCRIRSSPRRWGGRWRRARRQARARRRRRCS